ncbi:MAG: T9SS type A sorting domain-containing protein [Bacteroidales bacterium]|nr:T9SS type A sorting domain-containing protein [Bacteroidales bacterium]
MKKLYFTSLSLLFILLSQDVVKSQTGADSITMGAGYANDIYYSFSDGMVHSVPRTNWDIAFYTLTWSAGVIINDGNGVELRVYANADTSGWNAVDTTGLSTWPLLFNSVDSWEQGAFNQPPSNHPDYGWGVYNTITHDVVGDSIYIIKLADATYRKFWIIKKISIQNVYVFRFANLDGSNEVEVTLDCNDYIDKNFVYYSISNEEILDREPIADNWDILFTKYMEMVQDQPYPVTGVLNNINVPANRFEMVDPDFNDWTATEMDSTKSPIGYDWKHFDMSSFTYIVEDSLVFFVRNMNKDVYKLVFTAFDYTEGKAVFEKSKVHTSAIIQTAYQSRFELYPNPAENRVTIGLPDGVETGRLILTDMTGKALYQIENMEATITLDIDFLRPGVYFISIRSGNLNTTQKLIVR